MIRILKALGVGALIVLGAPIFVIWKIIEVFVIFALGILSIGGVMHLIHWAAVH